MAYRKISTLALAAACLVLLAGCKKDAQVDSVLADLDSFTQELVKKVEGAPNPSAGVDEAQKYLESRRADLRPKIESLSGLRGFQVSQETQKKMMERFTESIMTVNKLKIKYIGAAMRDPALNAKLNKLVADYNALVTPPTPAAAK